jgi:hypothetical protein
VELLKEGDKMYGKKIMKKKKKKKNKKKKKY